MDIRIIKAVESDRAFFRRVHHESYRDSIERMFGWDELLQDRFADSDFDNRNVHILWTGGQACGVVGWQDADGETELGPLYLLPEYQGRGVGRGVIQIFIQRSTDSCTLLKLKTLRSNQRAKRLYEKLGFVVTADTEQYCHMEHRLI